MRVGFPIFSVGFAAYTRRLLFRRAFRMWCGWTGFSSDAFQKVNVGRPQIKGQSGIPLFTHGPVVNGKLFTDGRFRPVWGPQYAIHYGALPGADRHDAGKANSGIVPVVQGYWTSFVSHGVSRGKVAWQPFIGGCRLRLQTNQTAMEDVLTEDITRSDFWLGLSDKLRIRAAMRRLYQRVYAL